MSSQMSSIPMPSMARVKPRIYNNVDKREFSELVLIISPTAN